MKHLIFSWVILSSSLAFSECNIEPLKKEIASQYKLPLPVTNQKGETGSATVRRFKVSDYLMKLKNESFLIANIDLDIKWQKGQKQTVKTLLVASVDPATCTIERYENNDTVGTSMSAKVTR